MFTATTSFWQLVKFRALIFSILTLLALLGSIMVYPVTAWNVIVLVLCTLLATNLAQLQLPRAWHESQLLFVVCCALDLLAIFTLLALSGGVSNGFVALLLLPVAVVAVLLPAWLSYVFALGAITAYSLLLWMGDLTQILQAAEGIGHHMLHTNVMQPFSRHMWQMWCAFVISAIVISWFISRQTALNRTTSEQLNQLQQQQVRQEHALAIATYAANAAHDLASPIQNLLLLTDEVQPLIAAHPATADMQQQLRRCQQIISELRQHAGEWRDLKPAPLLPILRQSLKSWMATRPDIHVTITENTDDSRCHIKEATAVAAALFQILDNAADAGLQQQKPELELKLTLQQGQLSLCIIDFGEGLSEQRLAELGHLPQHSEQGLGWGQFLANVSIERLGGQIKRRNRSSGGMETLLHFGGQA